MKKRFLTVKYVDEVKMYRTGKEIDPFRDVKVKLFDIYAIDAFPGDFWQLRKSVRDYDDVLVTFHDEDKPHSPTIGMKGKKYMEIARKHNLRLIKSKKPTITFNPNYNVIMDEFSEQKINIGILDKVEKEYLSAVIKPFRDNVEYITKFKDRVLNEEFIGITCKGAHDFIAFPNFKCDTMYKGMERCKEYALKELGL